MRADASKTIAQHREPEHYEQANQAMTFLRNRISLLIVIIAGFALAACSGMGSSALIDAGTGCIGDSSECVSRRQAALNEMTGDASHAWVYRQARGSAYLSGVRAFAYRSAKNRLSCAQLHHGMEEMAAAPRVLARDDPSGGDPAQLSRAKMLSATVNRELSKEYSNACLSPKRAKPGHAARGTG